MELAALSLAARSAYFPLSSATAPGCPACAAAGGTCPACKPAPTLAVDTYTPGERPDEVDETQDAARESQPTSEAEDDQALTPEEQSEVDQLRARDAEVRAHEAAHQAAGGGLTGGASYTYQSGPDGKRYAIGGEVQIDSSPEREPAATIAKMMRVKAAALAPAQPSSQDLAVATQAEATAQQARQELARNRSAAASAYADKATSPGTTIDVAA
jgi:hypothetical protein